MGTPRTVDLSTYYDRLSRVLPRLVTQAERMLDYMDVVGPQFFDPSVEENRTMGRLMQAQEIANAFLKLARSASDIENDLWKEADELVKAIRLMSAESRERISQFMAVEQGRAAADTIPAAAPEVKPRRKRKKT
jgi:predicted N-formylglutamate amidohydrolase